MISASLDRWCRVNYRCTSVDLFLMAGYQYLHCVIHLTDYRTKEGRSVLFNDALNTFYLRLYGVRHMVKDHSDSKRERERNVLFNDILNTFYLQLYGVRHMVKDHSDSEKGNPLPPHGLLFPINSKGYFICNIPQTG